MKSFSLICLMLAAWFAVRAQTNTSTSAVGTNATQAAVQSNAPGELRMTDIKSKSCEFLLKSNVFIYHDDVHLTNAQMKLTCELLTVEAPKMTNGKFERGTAETNVVIDWVDSDGTNHATSDKAVYTYDITNLTEGQTPPHFETNAIVVLSGNPVVTNKSTVFYGDPIIWDRIADKISSPNFKNQILYQGATNTSAIFEPASPAKSAKTNTHAK